MGAPSTPILDDFSSPALAGWTQPTWDCSTGFTASAGTLRATTPGVSDTGGIVWTDAFPAGDLEAYIEMDNGPHNGQELNLQLSNDPVNMQGYGLLVESAAGNWTIRRWVDNFTQTGIASGVQAIAAGEQVCIQRIGTEVNLWIFTGGSWVQFESIVDATYMDVAYIGIKDFDGTNIYGPVGGGNPVEAAVGYIPVPFPPTIHGRGAA